MAGPGTPTGPQSLLGQALASLVNNAPVTFLRTRAPGPLLAHTAETTPVYSRDIAPVFHQYCAKCHRSDGVAPFAMTNHSVVEAWAPAIKHALLSGQMPPWHADPEYGRFANDLSLPGHLKSTLIRWIDAGAKLELLMDPQPRWLVYGSSITQCGTAASPTETWPAIVARAKGLNHTNLEKSVTP